MPSMLRAAACGALCFSFSASAQEPPAEPPWHPVAPEPQLEATVEGDRPFSAASARTVRDRDFLLRPRFTPEDVLRVVPGLVLAQHQGGGKADQIFLRGFDADHGTDVSVNLDGVPVNMPSHAHGQGFADLHFLIPEVLERVEVTKGPYFAESGDFDTAGAVNLVTRDRFQRSQVSVQSGIFPTLSGERSDKTPRRFAGFRVLGIASAQADLHPFFAAEVYGQGGPFLNSERLGRYNLFVKASGKLSESTTVSLLATAYASSWVGSGQIPSRLVDSGVLDRYGAVDPTEGGDTQRQQAILALVSHPDRASTFTATLSGIRYGLTLFNDFTFQARDPVHGDEIEQDDQRTTVYAAVKYERSDRAGAAGKFVTTLGAQYRNDEITTGLWKVEKRARLARCLDIDNPCVDTSNRQSDAAAFFQEDFRPTHWLRLIGGLRDDLFEFDVHSLKASQGLDAGHPNPLPPTVQRSILSPKASLVLSPLEELDVFLNFGSGFHSNDARGVIETGGKGALPRALGYEVGVRTRLFDNSLDLAAALWRLDLDSELVWNGDEGGTTPSGSTRREGVDFEGRYQILSWLYADLDVSLARSRFKTDSGNGNAVALAPPRIATFGITARHPSGIQASLRVRHIGDRPGSQLTASDPLDPARPGGPRVPRCTPAFDASTQAGARCYLVADGYTVFDATLAYAMPRWSVMLVGENLANSVYREAQFGNVSQVIARSGNLGPGFTPEAHPVQDIHFTPGNPLVLQLIGTVFF
jgi:outer membrane receptor protein involved in Fe transport